MKDLNNTTNYKYYFKSNNYYEIFKTILISLIHDKKICLLDGDFTNREIEKLIGCNKLNKEIHINKSNFKSFNDVLFKINNKKMGIVFVYVRTTGHQKN